MAQPQRRFQHAPWELHGEQLLANRMQIPVDIDDIVHDIVGVHGIRGGVI